MVIPASARSMFWSATRMMPLIHWFQGVVQFQLFSDRGPQVNIEADVFITLSSNGTNAVSVATTSFYLRRETKPQKRSVQP